MGFASMEVLTLVSWLETRLFAVVEAYTKLDLGNGAGTEIRVTDGASDGGSSSACSVTDSDSYCI